MKVIWKSLGCLLEGRFSPGCRSRASRGDDIVSVIDAQLLALYRVVLFPAILKLAPELTKTHRAALQVVRLAFDLQAPWQEE